jgi:uncharacterized SAM-binding protein YcdF (DUF218 family)
MRVIYLSKTAPLLLLPVGVTLILLMAGLVFRRRVFFMVALGLLYTGSIPLVGRQALKLIEGDAIRSLPQSAPSGDAIVVLSGGRILAPGTSKISEWTDADRFFGGVELYQAGKAPLLVFTGGAAPWEPSAPSEGEILVGFARRYGVPAEAVVTTGKVYNTAEEAEAVAHLLADRSHVRPEAKKKMQSILLVTSAFHMSRAKAQFESNGFRVVAYPVDFLVTSGRQITILDFLPSANALSQTELAIREFYGRIFYQIRQAVRRN